MRKQQGFTLIELLIVLAILGILVGIVAMSVGDLTQTANERGMESEAEIVQTAMDTYMTQDVLVEGLSAPADISSQSIITTGNPIGKYLKTETKYYYTFTAPSYTVWVTSTAP